MAPLESGRSDDDLVPVLLCGRCRRGDGGECHTPGCGLWMNRAPDIPVAEQYEGDDDPPICARVLVGQGADSWDPLCVLEPGHAGACRKADYWDAAPVTGEQR